MVIQTTKQIQTQKRLGHTKNAILAQKKIPPRGVEPLSGNSKAPVNKQLMENSNSVLSTSLDNLVQIYPDLAQLVKVWPQLPEDTKKAIKALIQKHMTEIK